MNLSTNDIIKRARKTLGITQEVMAKNLNMRRSTYAYKEQKGNFTFDEVKTVSRILNIPIQSIADPSFSNLLFHIPEETEQPPMKLETNPPILESIDPLDGVITHNERQLLKGYRELKSQEAKDKLK
ncbi:MAG: helix-turn-helix transcriptional regulator, partial [Clostridiales bacterium]|nr:helix-turn-helix transcriptional regulator [Candidatus Equinaster intestinalis]